MVKNTVLKKNKKQIYLTQLAQFLLHQKVGSFKKGKIDGKGVLFYNNSKIKYNGDYVEDRREGKGLFFYLNGSMYIGDFKSGI